MADTEASQHHRLIPDQTSSRRNTCAIALPESFMSVLSCLSFHVYPFTPIECTRRRSRSERSESTRHHQRRVPMLSFPR